MPSTNGRARIRTETRLGYNQLLFLWATRPEANRTQTSAFARLCASITLREQRTHRSVSIRGPPGYEPGALPLRYDAKYGCLCRWSPSTACRSQLSPCTESNRDLWCRKPLCCPLHHMGRAIILKKYGRNITAKKGRGIWQRRSRPSSFPLLFGVVSLFPCAKGSQAHPSKKFRGTFRQKNSSVPCTSNNIVL